MVELTSECGFLERKRKATVENADKRSRMLASHWKNNVIECFDGIMKYWTFHYKKYGNHAHNRLWKHLHDTPNSDPNAPRSSSVGPDLKPGFYLGFSVDWIYLLRSGRGFNKGIAAVMSTTFDIWNQFIPVGKRHYKDSQGRYCDRVTSNVSRDRNFPFDISAYFKFARDSIAHYGDDPKVIPNLIRTLGEDLPVPFRNKAPETALLLAFDACYAKQGGLKYFFSLVLHAAQTDSELRDDLNNYVNFQILQDLLNNDVVRWPD